LGRVEVWLYGTPIPSPKASDGRGAGYSRIAAVLLLLILFGQLILSARSKSLTIDEPNHLTRGYAYLKTGDLRMSRPDGHPPLFNLISALPLALLDDLPLPLHSASWASGFRNAFVTEFIFSGAVPTTRLAFLGRLPVMLAALCLAALVARWAGELYGPWGGVVALFLCVLDPNLIAHGRLATTDLALTFTFVLAVYLFWRTLLTTSWISLVLTGVALGLAQGVKFSGILLLPVLGLLGLLEVFQPDSRLATAPLPWQRSRGGTLVHPGDSGRATSRREQILHGLLVLTVVMGVIVVLAALTLWAIYGLKIGRPAGWSIAVPAPDYFASLRATLDHAAEAGHPAYLMGDRSVQGWWYYFPVAFLLKTPLPSLTALLCAVASTFWLRGSRAELPLLVVPALYLCFSMMSALNIGYRHLLPMLPFLWIYVGRLGAVCAAAYRTKARFVAIAAVAVIGLWLAVATFTVAPHYLTFFNAIAGGPLGGSRYLVDSNLDWGQDLPALKAYLENEGIFRVYLSYFGSTYPYLFGLGFDYDLLPSHFSYPYPSSAARSPYNPYHPAPGLYAIGATNLTGVGLAEGDVFKAFRPLEPVARVANSVYVYSVAEVEGGYHPTAISGLRFKDLTDETREVSLRRGPGPVKWFGHEASFLVPEAGDPAYVLPAPPLGFAPDWQSAFLDGAEIVHQQAEEGGKPAALVYGLDRASADAWLAEVMGSIATAPASWSPAITFEGGTEVHPLSAPVLFDYGLELLGYRYLSGDVLEPGQTHEMITVWRVTEEMPPEAADLKAFAHLLDESGRVTAAEDRLDLHPPTWEPGDVLIQYHRLPLATDAAAGAHQVEIGLYTPIRMQRLAVFDQGEPVADRLLLAPIQVPKGAAN
jgi:hypothetical protein